MVEAAGGSGMVGWLWSALGGHFSGRSVLSPAETATFLPTTGSEASASKLDSSIALQRRRTSTSPSEHVQATSRRRPRRRWRWMSSGSTAALLLLASSYAGWCPVVAGQHVVATKFSGSAFADYSSGLVMSTEEGGSKYMVRVQPMTEPLGLNQTTDILEKVNISGDLDLYTTDRRGQFTGPYADSLAYISCDPTSGRRNASRLFESAVALKFAGVIFYSTKRDVYCHFKHRNGIYGFINVFTTVNGDKAQAIESVLERRFVGRPATIVYDRSYVESESPSIEGQSTTVAVALFVVYAFAAVLALLFLYVLVTGAVRAHRNPERYGPRVAMNGRPRQSRARGLARAVVETLPIVRFNTAGGEDGPPIIENKPGDIEMGRANGRFSRSHPAAFGHRSGNNNPEYGSEIAAISAQHPPLTAEEADIITASATPSTNEAPLAATQLHCPVCQDDFESGQQLRVLPCNHSFHQHCIDPWLLNVSGSCPLCRIDLRPEDARRSFQMPAPPTTDVRMITQPRFIRYIDIYRSTASNSTERALALRNLREERRGRSARPELGFTRLAGFIKKKMNKEQSSETGNGSGSGNGNTSNGGRGHSQQPSDGSEEELRPPMSENEIQRIVSHTRH